MSSRASARELAGWGRDDCSLPAPPTPPVSSLPLGMTAVCRGYCVVQRTWNARQELRVSHKRSGFRGVCAPQNDTLFPTDSPLRHCRRHFFFRHFLRVARLAESHVDRIAAIEKRDGRTRANAELLPQLPQSFMLVRDLQSRLDRVQCFLAMS